MKSNWSSNISQDTQTALALGEGETCQLLLPSSLWDSLTSLKVEASEAVLPRVKTQCSGFKLLNKITDF